MTALPSSAPAVSGVETFLEMLAAERGAAQNTLEAYRRDLDAYAGFLAGRGGEVATAGPDDIRAFLGRLAQAGMAPRTAARRLPALPQFYRLARTSVVSGNSVAVRVDSGGGGIRTKKKKRT